MKINNKELEILKDDIYSDYLGYSKEEIKHRILLDVIIVIYVIINYHYQTI